MKKHRQTSQHEMTFKAEPFALIQETGIDFTKVLERENQKARDRAESQSKNLQLFEK
jgi:hypothetical protein